VKRDLQELGWRGLTILGVFVGLFMGLAIAPELPGWAPWALAVGIVLVFIVVLILKRRRPE
jgi:uncharacterized membrane protein YoaK (UPF0700 family)